MRRIWRRAGAAAAALALLAAAAALAAAPGGSASPTPGQARVTDEDLLAAGLQWSDVRGAMPPGWWPEFPQFNSGLEPGRRTARVVATSYVFVSPDFGRATDDRVVSAVSLLPSRAAADADYRRLRARDGGSTVAGPAVKADRWRYSRVEGKGSVTTTLRWQIGPFVGRVSGTTFSGPSPESLARLFAPVGARVARLRAGTFRSRPLTVKEQQLLPPVSMAPGPVMGTARVPVEAWAVADTSGRPLAARDKLRAGGVGSLLLRRFALRGAAGSVVEAVLFSFSSPEAARTWAEEFAGSWQGKPGTLDPGATGDVSAFTSNNGEFYELQFAQGRYVADISCFAPFGKPAPACEAATRRLAERWYAALGSL